MMPLAYSRKYFTPTETLALPEEDADTVEPFVQRMHHGLRWSLSCLSSDRFMQPKTLYRFADRVEFTRVDE